MSKSFYHIISIFFILLLYSACKEPGDNVHINLTEYTLSDQALIGDAIKDEVLSNPSKFPVLSEHEYPEAYNYLNVLMKTLLTTDVVKRRENYTWELIILNDDARKSVFTAPGGKIFIYSGLLKFIHTESEFMCLLAHEIYYTDSDAIINQIGSQISNVGFIFGDVVLDNPDADIDQIVCLLRDLRFSADDVRDADDFALDVLCNFQYDAFGLKDLLMEADASNELIDWINTRPIVPNRLENIMERASLCGMEEDTFEDRYQRFLQEYFP